MRGRGFCVDRDTWSKHTERVGVLEHIHMHMHRYTGTNTHTQRERETEREGETESTHTERAYRLERESHIDVRSDTSLML